MQLPDPNLPWPLPMAAVALIAEREGCRLRAYRNYPNEPWTCGWGETHGVGPDTVWTQQEADQRFLQSLIKFSGAVEALCKVRPTRNQLGAMSSLAYNVGLGWTGAIKPSGAKNGFANSSVLAAHNRGDHQAAARAFSLWNKADTTGTGVLTELAGLTARRAAEAALYLTPEPSDAPVPMPQVVEGDSSLVDSGIVKGGSATAASGILVALNEFKDELGPVGGWVTSVKTFLADVLGVPPSWILPAVLIAAGFVVIRWRLTQRRKGWA